MANPGVPGGSHPVHRRMGYGRNARHSFWEDSRGQQEGATETLRPAEQTL